MSGKLDQNINSLGDFKSLLDENIELRKALAKLEELFKREKQEREEIQRLYENVKILNEKTKNECLDLNQKLSWR
jgi:hypothetical protein